MNSTQLSFLGTDRSKDFYCRDPNEADLRSFFLDAVGRCHSLNDIVLAVEGPSLTSHGQINLGYFLGVKGYALISHDYVRLLDGGHVNDEILFTIEHTDVFGLPSRFFYPIESMIQFSLNVIKHRCLPPNLKWETLTDHAIEWPDSITIPEFGGDYQSHLLPRDIPRIKRF
jgi:hypothetical protein